MDPGHQCFLVTGQGAVGTNWKTEDLNMRKIFSGHWHRLLRAAESRSLEILKNCLDALLWNLLYGTALARGWTR